MMHTRREYLSSIGAIGILTFSGCLGGGNGSRDITTATDTAQDSDGDGVINRHDYAPRDPLVQEKSDISKTVDEPGSGTSTTRTRTETKSKTSEIDAKLLNTFVNPIDDPNSFCWDGTSFWVLSNVSTGWNEECGCYPRQQKYAQLFSDGTVGDTFRLPKQSHGFEINYGEGLAWSGSSFFVWAEAGESMANPDRWMKVSRSGNIESIVKPNFTGDIKEMEFISQNFGALVDYDQDGESKLHYINSQGKLRRAIIFSENISSFTWDGSNFWGASESSIYKFNSEGQKVGSFTNPRKSPEYLEWINGFLWLVDSSNRISKFSIQ